MLWITNLIPNPQTLLPGACRNYSESHQGWRVMCRVQTRRRVMDAISGRCDILARTIDIEPMLHISRNCVLMSPRHLDTSLIPVDSARPMFDDSGRLVTLYGNQRVCLMLVTTPIYCFFCGGCVSTNTYIVKAALSLLCAAINSVHLTVVKLLL